MKTFLSLLVGILGLIYQTKCQTTVNLFGVSITYTNRGSQTDFYVTTPLGNGVSPSNAWLGVGINLVQDMNPANVMICRNGPSANWVESYLNQNDISSPYPSGSTVGLIGGTGNVTFVNSNLTCTFSRSNSHSDPNYINVTSSTPLYLLVAYGTGNL